MAFIPISYLGAEDKETVVPPKDKTSKPLKGYPTLPAKHAYYFKEGMTKETEKTDFLNCVEGQRRIISFGRVDAVRRETKTYRGFNSSVWITIQCMKNKKYVETKHKIFEYPYPDEDHASIDY
jgi:hypothetical protein